MRERLKIEALKQQVILQIVRDILDAELTETLQTVLECERRQQEELERLLAV
jgi:hypothetical protein